MVAFADLILDVALEVHRGVKIGADDLADLESDAKAEPQPPVLLARHSGTSSGVICWSCCACDRGSCHHPLGPLTEPRLPERCQRVLLLHLDTGGRPPCSSRLWQVEDVPLSSWLTYTFAWLQEPGCRACCADPKLCNAQTASRGGTRRGPLDVFGQLIPPVATDLVACTNCGKRMAAGRRALHTI